MTAYQELGIARVDRDLLAAGDEYRQPLGGGDVIRSRMIDALLDAAAGVQAEDRRGLRRRCDDESLSIDAEVADAADRLGIGYEALRERNPRIVYASLSGYGQDGPWAQRAGHDANYEAAVRLRLDTTLLPKPFQVSALTARDLHLETPWKRFTVRSPRHMPVSVDTRGAKGGEEK